MLLIGLPRMALDLTKYIVIVAARSSSRAPTLSAVPCFSLCASVTPKDSSLLLIACLCCGTTTISTGSINTSYELAYSLAIYQDRNTVLRTDDSRMWIYLQADLH